MVALVAHPAGHHLVHMEAVEAAALARLAAVEEAALARLVAVAVGAMARPTVAAVVARLAARLVARLVALLVARLVAAVVEVDLHTSTTCRQRRHRASPSDRCQSHLATHCGAHKRCRTSHKQLCTQTMRDAGRS